MTIRDQKLLYHLTAVENLNGIFERGLLPRSAVNGFEDVADSEIIAKRCSLKLENYVPFHWFSKNPFDGAEQMAHRTMDFALITVRRELAREENWHVVPRHPLGSREIELFDYQPGFDVMQWDVMDRRDYSDPECKSICMAECLSPKAVPVESFFKVYVPNPSVLEHVAGLAGDDLVSLNSAMFLAKAK